MVMNAASTIPTSPIKALPDVLLPEKLKKQWSYCWPDKVPRCLNGLNGSTYAKCNDPATWDYYRNIEAALNKTLLPGPFYYMYALKAGFFTEPGDVGIDLDDPQGDPHIIDMHIIADLRKHGVELISVCEPDLSSDDPSRKLMRQIFGAIAEYDKAMIVLKLKVARQRLRALTGRCEGRKPYGERAGEQQIIGRIIKLRGEGFGMDRIAERLNAEGVKPRTGVKWYPMSISRVLERAEIAVRSDGKHGYQPKVRSNRS